MSDTTPFVTADDLEKFPDDDLDAMKRWIRNTEAIVVGLALAAILVAYVVSRFSN